MNKTVFQEVDEWKDFEEEKKDYTGLKIGHLSISGNGEGSAGNTDGGSDLNHQGLDESGNEQDRKTGPWKRMGNESAAPAPEVEKPVVEPSPPARSATGGYVAPHLRNQNLRENMQPSKLKSKTAPDIHNEDSFPTLSGGRTAEPAGAWGRR